jgi:hypothetical protein
MIIQFVKFNSHLSNAEVQRVMKERAPTFVRYSDWFRSTMVTKSKRVSSLESISGTPNNLCASFSKQIWLERYL